MRIIFAKLLFFGIIYLFLLSLPVLYLCKEIVLSATFLSITILNYKLLRKTCL